MLGGNSWQRKAEVRNVNDGLTVNLTQLNSTSVLKSEVSYGGVAKLVNAIILVDNGKSNERVKTS